MLILHSFKFIFSSLIFLLFFYQFLFVQVSSLSEELALETESELSLHPNIRTFRDGYYFQFGDSAGYDMRYLPRTSISYKKWWCNRNRHCLLFNNWGCMKYFQKPIRRWWGTRSRWIHSYIKVPRQLYCDGFWALVRHVPQGYRWHPARDHCMGYRAYGYYRPDPVSRYTFSMAFAGFNYYYMKFSTGDGTKYLITNRYQVQRWGWNHHKYIYESHRGKNYRARMYQRWWRPEDPWISATDYHSMPRTQEQPLYGEASNGWWNKWLRSKQGANVWIFHPGLCPIGKCTIIQPQGCSKDGKYSGAYSDPVRTRFDPKAHANYDLCLQRAESRHKECGNGPDSPTVAQWNKRGQRQMRRAYPETYTCMIKTSCTRFPNSKRVNGNFRDVWGETYTNLPASISEENCLKRARDYHLWCRNPFDRNTIATFTHTGKTAEWPGKGCWISQPECPRNPSKRGYFRDIAAEIHRNAGFDEAQCLQRAKQWNIYCGNSPIGPTTAYYLPEEKQEIYPEPIQHKVDYTKYIDQAKKAAEASDVLKGQPTEGLTEVNKLIDDIKKEEDFVNLYLTQSQNMQFESHKALRVIENTNLDEYLDEIKQHYDEMFGVSIRLKNNFARQVESQKLYRNRRDVKLEGKISDADIWTREDDQAKYDKFTDNEIKHELKMEGLEAELSLNQMGIDRKYAMYLSNHEKSLMQARDAYINEMKAVIAQEEKNSRIKQAITNRQFVSNEESKFRRHQLLTQRKADIDRLIFEKNSENDQKVKYFHKKLLKDLQDKYWAYKEKDDKRYWDAQSENNAFRYKIEDQLDKIDRKFDQNQEQYDNMQEKFNKRSQKNLKNIQNIIEDNELNQEDKDWQKQNEYELAELKKDSNDPLNDDQKEEKARQYALEVKQMTDCARCHQNTECPAVCITRSTAAKIYVSNPDQFAPPLASENTPQN